MWITKFLFLAQFVLITVQGFTHQKHYGMITVSMRKPLRSNNNDEREKDQLLAKIAAKEAEFQAELDKLLAEARNNNDKEVKDFNDKDLAKAISEMQKLNKNKSKSSSSISDDEITNFLQKMSKQVSNLSNKQQQAIMDAESSFVRVVIPPGVRPGETMVVQLRNGMFEIEVPYGTQEGDEIEVELPASLHLKRGQKPKIYMEKHNRFGFKIPEKDAGSKNERRKKGFR